MHACGRWGLAAPGDDGIRDDCRPERTEGREARTVVLDLRLAQPLRHRVGGLTIIALTLPFTRPLRPRRTRAET